MTHLPRTRAMDASLVLLAAIWGVNFSVLKIVLVELDPLVLNALRFPLAAAVLGVAVVARRGPSLPRRRDLPAVLALGLVGHLAYQLCFIYGLDWTRAGNASLLLSTTPVWTVTLSTLLGHERLSASVVAGIVTTLVGMVLVISGGGSSLSLGSETLRGDLMMIAGAMLWSVYTVSGRGLLARYGALRVTTWALWAATPALVAMGTPGIFDTDLGALSTGAWAGVVYAGVLGIALAYLIWYRGVKTLGNSRTAIYSNLVPVWALLAAWVWIDEVPTVLQLAGAAVILAGLSVARLGRLPASPGSPTPPDPTPRPDR